MLLQASAQKSHRGLAFVHVDGPFARFRPGRLDPAARLAPEEGQVRKPDGSEREDHGLHPCGVEQLSYTCS